MIKWLKSQWHEDRFMTTAVIIVIATIIGILSVAITNTPDNVVEEVAEAVIEQEAGLPAGSVDLTPRTGEETRASK